jgi:hypothetical protein
MPLFEHGQMPLTATALVNNIAPLKKAGGDPAGNLEFRKP